MLAFHHGLRARFVGYTSTEIVLLDFGLCTTIGCAPPSKVVRVWARRVRYGGPHPERDKQDPTFQFCFNADRQNFQNGDYVWSNGNSRSTRSAPLET